MTTSTKPTLLMVPGSFCPASHYDPQISALRSKGYAAESVSHKTVGKRKGPLPTMYDDAAAINAAATKLADAGKEIVLVAHSYGGVPASQSLKGVTKAEREKEGKKGGVVRVAYMTALVPEMGQAAGSVLVGESDEPSVVYITPDEDGWFYHVDKNITAPIVFSSLSPEKGLEAFEVFQQHSSISFANELTHAGYKDVPVSYLFCEEDKCVKPDVQQRCIDNVEKATGKKVDVTRIPADHCPEISAPDSVVDWFVGLLEKGGKE